LEIIWKTAQQTNNCSKLCSMDVAAALLCPPSAPEKMPEEADQEALQAKARSMSLQAPSLADKPKEAVQNECAAKESA
jgi:hypothetical protein